MQIILPIPSFDLIDLLQVLMFLLAFFVLMFHCFIKPYKKEASNVIETLILLNLLLVAAVYLEAPQDQLHVSLFIVILTVLPYLYAVGFLIWLAVKKMLVNYVMCFYAHYAVYTYKHCSIQKTLILQVLCSCMCRYI